jgi:hypothetical protein
MVREKTPPKKKTPKAKIRTKRGTVKKKLTFGGRPVSLINMDALMDYLSTP